MGNNKAKNKKSRMSPETKEKLKTGFGTLISNDACIKAGREYPWYTPVILAVCSVVITLIPSFVNTMKVNMGESVLGTSAVSGIENGLASFQETLKASTASVKINDNGELEVSNETSLYNASSGDISYYEYTVKYEEKTGWTEEPILRVIFTSDDVSTTVLDSLSQYSPNIKTITTASDGTTSETTAKGETAYRVSVLAFKKTGFSMAVYNRRVAVSTSTALVNYSYDRLKGTDIKSLCASVALAENPNTCLAEVKKNYQNFLTLGYETTKISLAWRNVGILSGINAGVILLLGLVLFLITRGKKNPYRVITFWQNQKIAYWAAPAPAVLAMGLGFLLSNVSTMSSLSMFMFLFLYGLRIMWTSMKAFSPARN